MASQIAGEIKDSSILGAVSNLVKPIFPRQVPKKGRSLQIVNDSAKIAVRSRHHAASAIENTAFWQV
jgi:hypothetical protein